MPYPIVLAGGGDVMADCSSEYRLWKLEFGTAVFVRISQWKFLFLVFLDSPSETLFSNGVSSGFTLALSCGPSSFPPRKGGCEAKWNLLTPGSSAACTPWEDIMRGIHRLFERCAGAGGNNT